MAGHSKWANIKHRKAAQDAKRGRLFTRLLREITIAARQGADSPRLRLGVSKALGANIPRDTIDRAVLRGSGGEGGDVLQEMLYEGYATAGVAVLVECVSDNRNRTISEVRHAFSKYWGNLGAEGSVAYMFQKRGLLVFAPGVDVDRVLEVALNAGAEDVQQGDDESVEVYSSPGGFEAINNAFTDSDLQPDSAEITYIPDNWQKLQGEDAEKAQTLLDELEGLDDTQNVYSNASFV